MALVIRGIAVEFKAIFLGCLAIRVEIPAYGIDKVCHVEDRLLVDCLNERT